MWDLAVLAHITMADSRQRNDFVWIHPSPLFVMCNGLHSESVGMNISYEYEMIYYLELKWAKDERNQGYAPVSTSGMLWRKNFICLFHILHLFAYLHVHVYMHGLYKMLS